MIRLKQVFLTLAIFSAGAMSGSLLVSCAGADQPHMAAAIDYLQHALYELQAAEPNKGGHRANAVRLTKAAIDEANAGMAYADY